VVFYVGKTIFLVLVVSTFGFGIRVFLNNFQIDERGRFDDYSHLSAREATHCKGL